LKKEIPSHYLRHLSDRYQVKLQGSGLSLRAVVLGLGLVVAISTGAPYSIWMVGSSEMTWSYFPIIVGAPLFALVLLNALLKRIRTTYALNAAELVTITIMGMVASGMPIFIVGLILSIVSKPYYGAMPDNKWDVLVQPYLPGWAIPSPAQDAMRFFYEGLPNKALAIPWGAWVEPLLWWMGLILALYFVGFCTVVVLRRHWMERERLTFPLTEVALMLTEEDPSSVWPKALRSRAFWIGFAIPCGLIAFTIPSYFHPGLVPVPIFRDWPVQLIPHAPPVNLLIYFPVLGFMYLVPTAISFSIWFFHLLHLGELGLINQLGIFNLRSDPYVYSWTPLSWQSWGAFVAMVGWSLWMARGHLAAVWRTALGRPGRVDDSDEMISYRVAVCGGLAGLAFILWWLWRSGLELPLAVLYLAGAMTIFLGITRLVVQAGMHYLTTPMSAQGMVMAVVGSGVGPQNLVALALTFAWCGDVQSTFMPSAANALKLHDYYTHRRNGGLALAIGLAVVVSFAATSCFMIYLCYDYGASNLRSWFFNAGGGAGGRAFDWVTQQLRDPAPTDWDKLSIFGSGAFAYMLLTFLHYRLAWWPLHPVGLAVASTWMVQRIAFSVFLAWACKCLVLRFGGVGLYQRLKPFFIGLVVGFFWGVFLSFGIDYFWFMGGGHPVLHG
jgi:hypothetical protein